jgi:four helix bundle protein
VDKQELQCRTKQFALRVFKLVDALPRTAVGRGVANQLVRSATSVGANYRAACRARSGAACAAKLGTVLEEADESLYWLELIREGKLIAESKLSLLLKETAELTAILAAVENRRLRRADIQHQTSNILHSNI